MANTMSMMSLFMMSEWKNRLQADMQYLGSGIQTCRTMCDRIYLSASEVSKILHLHDCNTACKPMASGKGCHLFEEYWDTVPGCIENIY